MTELFGEGLRKEMLVPPRTLATRVSDRILELEFHSFAGKKYATAQRDAI
jgi:hypothetical protein